MSPTSGWDLPPQTATQTPPAEEHAWAMPDAPTPGGRSVVRTGPSGLLLGHSAEQPVAVRLFRNRPTRVFSAVPDYVTWLVCYRAVALGAHLSVLATDGGRWGGLLRGVHASGGSADLLGPGQSPPGSGRPYRPSLVVDGAAHYDGSRAALGPWQAVLVEEDAAASGAVFALRSCDLALVARGDARVTENLRRAYALTREQVRECSGLAENEVALAMPRRVVRVQVPPTPTEYEVLFRG